MLRNNNVDSYKEQKKKKSKISIAVKIRRIMHLLRCRINLDGIDKVGASR